MGTVVVERHLLSPFCFFPLRDFSPSVHKHRLISFIQVTNPISSRSVNLNRRPHLRDVNWVSWGFGGFPHESFTRKLRWISYNYRVLSWFSSLVDVQTPCKNAGSLLCEIHNCSDSPALKDDATLWPKKHAGFLMVLKSCLNAIKVAVWTKERPDSPEFSQPSLLAKRGVLWRFYL